MKRFTVTNRKNGSKFIFEGLDAGPVLTEYGKPERWVMDTDIEREGLKPEDAIKSEFIGDGTLGRVGVRYLFAAEYSIEETDITDEIDAQKTKEKNKKDAADRVKAIDWSKVTSVNHVKAILKDLLDREG